MKKSSKIKAVFLTLVIVATAAAYGGCANSTMENASSDSSVAVTESSAESSSGTDSKTIQTESTDEEFSSNIRDDGKDGMAVIGYNGEANIINIPDSVKGESVKEIKGYFLRGKENVVEINVPDSVEEISDQAFALCTNLEKLTMGDNVRKIGQSLCLGNTKLEYVKLAGTLEDIPDYAFSNCTSLEEITIPDSVTTIGASFPRCSALKEVHMTDSVTFIGDRDDNEEYNTFEDSKDLTIYAPAGSYAESYAKKYNIPFVAE